MYKLLALATSAAALTQGPTPKAAAQTRRELGQGLLTAIGPAPASAESVSSFRALRAPGGGLDAPA